jgi:AraC-like DNA-binding protein
VHLYDWRMPQLNQGSMYVHHQSAAERGFAAERHHLCLEHATVADREHLSPLPRQTHTHDVYHLVLYTRGRGSFLLHERMVSYVAPYLVLTSPGQAHSFQGTTHEDGIYSELTFHARDPQGRVVRHGWADLLAGRFRHACPLPAHGPLSVSTAKALAEAIAHMVELGVSAPPMADALIHGYLEGVLFLLFRDQVAAASTHPVDAIEQARQLLESAGEAPLEAAALARAVGLSSKHLGRAFKRRFGLPPVQYRRHWSMQHAAILIRSTNLPLQDIAEQLGFQDPAYFSRVFRSVHGSSPQHYRHRQATRLRSGDP